MPFRNCNCMGLACICGRSTNEPGRTPPRSAPRAGRSRSRSRSRARRAAAAQPQARGTSGRRTAAQPQQRESSGRTPGAQSQQRGSSSTEARGTSGRTSGAQSQQLGSSSAEARGTSGRAPAAQPHGSSSGAAAARTGSGVQPQARGVSTRAPETRTSASRAPAPRAREDYPLHDYPLERGLGGLAITVADRTPNTPPRGTPTRTQPPSRDTSSGTPTRAQPPARGASSGTPARTQPPSRETSSGTRSSTQSSLHLLTTFTEQRRTLQSQLRSLATHLAGPNRRDGNALIDRVQAIHDTLVSLENTVTQLLQSYTRDDVARIGPVWVFYDVTARTGAGPMTEFNWARGYTLNMLQLLIRQFTTGMEHDHTARSLETLANLWDLQHAFPRVLADDSAALDFTIRGMHREPSRRPR